MISEIRAGLLSKERAEMVNRVRRDKGQYDVGRRSRTDRHHFQGLDRSMRGFPRAVRVSSGFLHLDEHGHLSGDDRKVDTLTQPCRKNESADSTKDETRGDQSGFLQVSTSG
jgi:hypothetical protein